MVKNSWDLPVVSLLGTLSASLDDAIIYLNLAFPPLWAEHLYFLQPFLYAMVPSSFADLTALLWVSSLSLPVFTWDFVPWPQPFYAVQVGIITFLNLTLLSLRTTFIFAAHVILFPCFSKMEDGGGGWNDMWFATACWCPCLLPCSYHLLVFCFKKKDRDSLCSIHRILAHGHLINVSWMKLYK